MALTNSEKQKRYRERHLRAMARTPASDQCVTFRSPVRRRHHQGQDDPPGTPQRLYNNRSDRGAPVESGQQHVARWREKISGVVESTSAMLLQEITEVDCRAEIAFRNRLGVSVPFKHRGKAVDVRSAGTKAQAPQCHPCCEISLQHRVLLSSWATCLAGNHEGEDIVVMGSGILANPQNPQLNNRTTRKSADQRTRQLPITEFAHKAGNGELTITCRNRHCGKCQGAAAKEWLAAREAELWPVPYFHIVFSLRAQIADIAYQNKAAIYDILFKASAETLLNIAADPKHLGARIGVLSVLHTWGSGLTVHLLSRLFRRLVLEKLDAAHRAGQRYGVMTLHTHEFIRRFLMHVLPQGFHRIRYYGLLTSPTRAQQHRAYPRAARSAAPPDQRHQGCHLKGRRAETARASPPMLRQPHAHHRDLLARARAQAPPDPTSSEDPDRHLMMTISEPSPRKAVPLSARSSAGHGSARSHAAFHHPTAPPAFTATPARTSQERTAPTSITSLPAQPTSRG
jgi:hypothetical protein